jgi:BirA family biotin operon repressor/biotin-[acetyl-CoA-carboxylase] ligase
MPLFELEAARIQSLLRTKCYGRSLTVLESANSTNDDARTAIELGAPDGHVIVADSQRAGRGSRGNLWSSPPGKDLYLSIVDRPQLVPRQLPLLSLAAGLGVAHAVEKLVGTSPRALVKWPNDVWLGGLKCAGILTETASKHPGAVVIGIGLNVNRRDWPGELSSTATSLVQAARFTQDIDRALALSVLLQEVERWVAILAEQGAKPIIAALEKRLTLRGAQVVCGQVQGTLVGIADNGAARIMTPEGDREVVTGTLKPVRVA